MSAKEAVKPLEEYRECSPSELVESSTNPRKTFDEERLEELAESIRSKGVLSPLLARRVNGHFEIVSGARRYRAAQRAGLEEVPVRIAVLTDAEALEAQIIENLLTKRRTSVRGSARVSRLLDREGAGYTLEQISTKTGKSASFIAKRLRLLDLIPSVAEAFTAGHIGIEHALLIAKLGAEAQEKALTQCFDGYYTAGDKERSLVPVSRLQAWIAQNVYLSLKSVPFSKDDETLVPEAGSCATCPKRTGFNTLLFATKSGRRLFGQPLLQSETRPAHRAAPRENAQSCPDFGKLQRDRRNASSSAAATMSKYSPGKTRRAEMPGPKKSSVPT